MTTKDIKEEARKKLALNMHQAIVIYTVEFTVFITLIALIVMSCVCLGVNTIAAIVMICYGCLLTIIAFVACGMANFAMVDFYLATYRCKPFNVRRLGDTLARSNITKIFLISLKRTVIAFLLLLCFIVPGVIYLIRTSMANYLLIANPKMKASSVLSASNKIMGGKTGAYFALCMSMFGWYVLGLFTLGLGFIFISPYINLVKAVYYKRNLQGDKTVYAIESQPVSPQVVQNGGAAVVNTPSQNQESPSVIKVGQAVAVEAVTAPIDTLAEEDAADLNAAMRDFGSQPEVKPMPEVQEVPIAPPTKKAKDEPVIVQPIVQVQPEPDNSSPKSMDDSNILESERILSAEEIDASAAVKEQAIANMYSNSGPQPSAVNYFANAKKQNPNDFVTCEVDIDGADNNTQIVENINGNAHVSAVGTEKSDSASDDIVISDSEFEAFLREFDNVPNVAPEFPLKRSSSADNNGKASTARGGNEHRVPERQSARASENGAPHTDRAERLRIERERKNLNNK